MKITPKVLQYVGIGVLFVGIGAAIAVDNTVFRIVAIAAAVVGALTWFIINKYG